MSPPNYPSAWLLPSRASFRFARQDHCSSAAIPVFSTSGLRVIQAQSTLTTSSRAGSLLVPVVQRRILAGWNDRLVSLAFKPVAKIRLCIQDQLAIRK